MVRSMVAGVAGLRTHQSKLDVIGNNIANVNTWGFKGASFNFLDSMYSTSINGAAGNDLANGTGGRNASQVGYGVTTGSIVPAFSQGAPSPSSDPMDCMIDGTGFFLVGKMINGSFTNVADSGLSLSRVGIFRTDSNGYLVDDQRNYVYGYALKPGTGIPEQPAVKAQWKIKGGTAAFTAPQGNTPGSIEIGSIKVETTKTDFKDAVNDWIKAVTGTMPDGSDGAFKGCTVGLNDYDAVKGTVNLTITANNAGAAGNSFNTAAANIGGTIVPTTGEDRVPGVEAEYSDELSVIQIPTDPKTNEQYEIQSYKINEDGTIVGVDKSDRVIAIGQIALVAVENPNGLEKSDGYYYGIGPNAGTATAVKPGSGPAGIVKGNYLEMANVDLANEFSQMITTQRGFQANSKIITVTDQMLEELVNMKR